MDVVYEVPGQTRIKWTAVQPNGLSVKKIITHFLRSSDVFVPSDEISAKRMSGILFGTKPI